MSRHKNGWDVLYLLLEAAAKLGALALIIAGVWLALLFVMDDPDKPSGRSAAYAAMRDVGLGNLGEKIRIDGALNYNTYFRDGDETVIFCAEYDAEEIWQAIEHTPGWKAAQITSADYTQLARAEFWGPADIAVPPEDMVFDAWFYRDDYLAQYGEPADLNGDFAGLPEVLMLNGTPDTLNATFAFFDRETGAFFYHSYDT